MLTERERRRYEGLEELRKEIREIQEQDIEPDTLLWRLYEGMGNLIERKLKVLVDKTRVRS